MIANAPTAWPNRILGEGEEAPDQLLANPRNWRIHPKAQQDALAGILSEVGWVQRVIVNQRTGHMIDGHARVALAITRGEPSVPVVYVDLSEDEERAVLASLDPLSAMAVADTEQLDALLGEISVKDEALRAMLDGLRSEPKAGLTDPDDVPEPPEPISKTGDLWICGDHRLLCGDATKAEDVERLMAGEKAALMVTDPPYGVGYETDGANRSASADSRPIANDDLGKDQVAFWQSAFVGWPLDGDAYIFSPSGPPITLLSAALAAAGIEHHQWLIWAKQQFALGRSHYHYRHEHIFYGWRGTSSWNGSRTEDSVWEADRPMASPEHPTMKPVVLCERAITNSSKPRANVVDPFLGSGTTMIACEHLGRRCYGMEIEPRYVDVAVKRWEGFTGKEAQRG